LPPLPWVAPLAASSLRFHTLLNGLESLQQYLERKASPVEKFEEQNGLMSGNEKFEKLLEALDVDSESPQNAHHTWQLMTLQQQIKMYHGRET